MVASDWFVGFRPFFCWPAVTSGRWQHSDVRRPSADVFGEGVCRLRADIDYICRRFNRAVYISVVQNILLGCLGCMLRWGGALGVCNAQKSGAPCSWLGLAGYDDAALAHVQA